MILRQVAVRDLPDRFVSLARFRSVLLGLVLQSLEMRHFSCLFVVSEALCLLETADILPAGGLI